MSNRKSILRSVQPSRIFIPISIGIGVVAFIFYKKFDPAVFDLIHFTKQTVFWIAVAFMLMLFRDIGYIIRLRIFSDNEFTWLQAFRITMLWEFTSAITPSAIGGTSVALLFLHKEGMSVGRASAIVMATSFLDELYFILVFPLLFIFIDISTLFSITNSAGVTSFSYEFFYPALIGYSIKVFFTIFLAYGLFFNPRGLKWLLLWIFKLPILRKWRGGANKAGSDIISSSKELRRKPLKFWLKAFAATIFSWTSRYWVINVLFLAFFAVPDHFLLFARQLSAWIMLLISPTPGGSGVAEAIFIPFMGDFIPYVGNLRDSMAALLALLWRLLSYYPYLIIGAILFPKWIRLKFGSKL